MVGASLAVFGLPGVRWKCRKAPVAGGSHSCASSGLDLERVGGVNRAEKITMHDRGCSSVDERETLNGSLHGSLGRKKKLAGLPRRKLKRRRKGRP